MVTLATEQIALAANKRLPDLIPCGCGCGIVILSFTENRPSHKRRFVSGHNGRGAAHWNWKGGRMKSIDGYWLVKNERHPRAKAQHGYVFEHIIVFEECHGCCMLPWGIVHHINEIKTDNRIENLQGVIRRQHMTLHRSGKKQSTETIRKRILTLKSRTNTKRLSIDVQRS